MTWTWDASLSPDVAAYILAVALIRSAGEPPVWTDVAQTTGLSLTDMTPDPETGAAWLYTVDAVDEAGYRSEK